MDYSALKAKIEAMAPALTPRARVAWAARCVDDVIHLLDEGCEPLDGELIACVHELAWTFATGQEVSDDERRLVLLQLGDNLTDAYSDSDGQQLNVATAAESALLAAAPDRKLSSVLTLAATSVAEAKEEDEYASYAERLDGYAKLADGDIVRPAPKDDVERARRERAQAARPKVVPKWREPSGLPARYEARKVGKLPSSSEGKIATSGQDVFALFDRETNAPVFERAGAHAFGMSPDDKTLFVWVIEKRDGVSGIARSHYDWVLETYAWPSKTPQIVHRIEDRKTMDWCWPLRLDVPAEGVAVLRARSEDWVAEIAVALRPDGPRESSSRDEAIAMMSS